MWVCMFPLPFPVSFFISAGVFGFVFGFGWEGVVEGEVDVAVLVGCGGGGAILEVLDILFFCSISVNGVIFFKWIPSCNFVLSMI